MTQVIRTNGDYKIQAKSNGAVITLDTPTVVVTGNLTVEGTRTDVNVNNLCHCQILKLTIAVGD